MIALFIYQSKYEIKLIHTYACLKATIIVFLAARERGTEANTLLASVRANV